MPFVSEPEIREFAYKALTTAGASVDDANATADGLVLATKRGITTHGVFRLPQYCDSIAKGKINGKPEVSVLKRRGVTALVNGDGGYGFRPGTVAMDLAIEIAREQGVAIVGVRNSHHFGAAAIYTERAALAGLIGLATTTTKARIPPTGAIGPVVGNNPISIAIPRRGHRPIILDMALSQVAMGRIRIAAANGTKVPEGWGYDKEGRATTDPNAILNDGLLAAVGEHKGYGLSVMVEVLAGILTGSPFAQGADNHAHPKGGVGHFFLAIAPDFMRDTDEFYADIEELVRQLKSSEPATGSPGVFLPGEPEDIKAAKADKDGLTISADLAGQLETLANGLGIPAPVYKS
jgi:LDH2 family malate/lactate/ureidoglycolate dehydrogenase